MNPWVRKFVVMPAAVLAAGAILYFGGRAALEALKNWQASRLASLSGEYAKEGLMQEAMMSADTALRLNPVQPEASRFMAGLMEAEGRWEQAMELYGRLYASGEGDLGDLKKQAINAARGEYIDPARWLAGRVAEKGEPGFPAVIEAEMLLKKGDVPGARRELQRAVAESGGSRPARAAMLRFLLLHPSDDRGKELTETIYALKDGNDEESLEALTVGLSSGVVPADQRPKFIAAIRRHPKKNERVLMLADTAELALDPASKPRVAAAMAERLRIAPLDERLVGAMWMNAQGLPQQAAAVLPLQDAKTNAAAMKTWLDAQAGLGQWNAMRAALAEKDGPLPPHMAQIYSARALKMSGNATQADAAYAAAVKQYADNPDATAEILEYLHRSGEYALFDAGLAPQLGKPGIGLDMVKALVPAILDTRDSARLRTVIAAALASPNLADNASLLNDATYLDLVLNRPVDAAAIRARQKQNPGDPAALFNLVLECLRAGNEAEALALLQNANLDIRTLAPNQLTVVACTLAANGKKEEALALASRIPAQRISTQELDLLKSTLAK
jgi:tetratricopeptide (TPR) repeat protein